MDILFDMLTVLYKYKKLYERRCQDTMKKYDLRIADIDILYYVAHSGPRNRSKDIVDIGMSKANVSKSVENLYRKGFVELTEDKEDRRCVHIELTGQAYDVIGEVSHIRRSIEQCLMVEVTDADKEAVSRVFHRVNENVTEELFCMEEKKTQEVSVQEQHFKE